MNGKQIIMAVLALLIVVPLVCIGWYFGTYNSLVSADLEVDNAWANVQSKLQRRYDLIPNLIASVKGYMAQEMNLLTQVTEARSQWGESLGKPIQEQVESASALENVLSRLMVVVTTENYPELKSDTLVIGLMDELAGSENRISVERDRYNKAVMNYNRRIRTFPANIVAGMAGFTQRFMFEASLNAQSPPVVDFET